MRQPERFRIKQFTEMGMMIALFVLAIAYANAETLGYYVPRVDTGQGRLVTGDLSGDDFKDLPDGVAVEFKDARNYSENGAIINQFPNFNNCSSFAINKFGERFYGGTVRAELEAFVFKNCRGVQDAFFLNNSLSAYPYTQLILHVCQTFCGCLESMIRQAFSVARAVLLRRCCMVCGL